MSFLINKVILKVDGVMWYTFAAILLRLMLELSYYFYVVPVHSYNGFLFQFDPSKYIESWALYILLIQIGPKKLKMPSDLLIAILLFTMVAPLLVFYGLSGSQREHMYVVLFGVVLVIIFSRGRYLKLPVINGTKNMLPAFLWFFLIAVTVEYIRRGGWQNLNFDLLRVYEFRQSSIENFGKGIFGYLTHWGSKVVGPMLLAISLLKRNYANALFIAIILIFWFGMSSHKATVFFPLAVFLMWFFFRSSKVLTIIPLGISLLIGFSLAFYLLLGETIAASLFIRRLLFLPAQLAFGYYEYFSQNQFVYWSNSIAASYIQYPYNLAPPELIGNYMGSGDYANTGFLATGYMHAGLSGILLYSSVAGLLLRLVDSISYKSLPLWFSSSIFLIPWLTLVLSSDLPTTLLSHGFSISLLFLFLYRSKKAHGTTFSN